MLQDELTPPPERRDDAALKAVLELQPEVYFNVVGDPTICLPLNAPSELRKPHYLLSSTVRAALFRVIKDAAGFLPYEQEVTRILWYLHGIALDEIRTNIGYREAIDAHPVVEAVHILMNERDGETHHESTAGDLLTELKRVAKDNRINVRQSSWPKAANVLSEELNNMRQILLSGGIRFERGRRNGKRHVSLTRTSRPYDDDESPALDRPDVNSRNPNSLGDADDGDGVAAALFARISIPLPETQHDPDPEPVP